MLNLKNLHVFLLGLLMLAPRLGLCAEVKAGKSGLEITLSDVERQRMKELLAKYPMKVQVTSQNKIMIRKSGELAKLLGEKVNGPEYDLYFLIPLQDNRKAYLTISIGTSADSQLQDTIEISYWGSIRSSAPNTWNSDSAKCFPIPQASFVVNSEFGGDVGYCINNLRISIGTWNGSKSISNEIIKSIANKINSLFDGDFDSLKKNKEIELTEAKPDELGITLQTISAKESSAVVAWQASETLKDHWIRMDSEAGQLAILEQDKQTASLKSIPSQGTAVHLYAISPDGKTWHHARLQIQPIAPKAMP